MRRCVNGWMCDFMGFNFKLSCHLCTGFVIGLLQLTKARIEADKRQEVAMAQLSQVRRMAELTFCGAVMPNPPATTSLPRKEATAQPDRLLKDSRVVHQESSLATEGSKDSTRLVKLPLTASTRPSRVQAPRPPRLDSMGPSSDHAAALQSYCSTVLVYL